MINYETSVSCRESDYKEKKRKKLVDTKTEGKFDKPSTPSTPKEASKKSRTRLRTQHSTKKNRISNLKSTTPRRSRRLKAPTAVIPITNTITTTVTTSTNTAGYCDYHNYY